MTSLFLSNVARTRIVDLFLWKSDGNRIKIVNFEPLVIGLFDLSVHGLLCLKDSYLLVSRNYRL